MLTIAYGSTYRFEMRSEPELRQVLLQAFPSYRKRDAYLSAFHAQTINSYWDGGSRDEYVLLDVATGRRLPLPTSSHPYFDVARHGLANAETDAVSVDRVGNITLKMLPPNCVLVRAGISCGKPATAHIFAHPDMMPKFLPAATVTTTEQWRIIGA